MTTGLEGGWAVTETADGLRLEKSPLDDRLVARRRLITAIGSTITAIALGLLGIDVPPGIGLIVWPMVGLFMLVSVLGVWAFAQARAAIAAPLVLDARTTERLLEGCSVETRARVTVPFAEVARVEVVRAPGLTVPVVTLQVVTNTGGVLVGPEVISGSDSAAASEELLVRTAERLAKAVGCACTVGAGAIEAKALRPR